MNELKLLNTTKDNNISIDDELEKKLDKNNNSNNNSNMKKCQHCKGKTLYNLVCGRCIVNILNGC